MYYNNYIEYNSIYDLMLSSTMSKKSSIKRVLKWVFGGFSIVFVAMLLIMTIHDSLIGGGVTTPVKELCTNYGFLASPECW
jgi:hypothetical protein